MNKNRLVMVVLGLVAYTALIAVATVAMTDLGLTSAARSYVEIAEILMSPRVQMTEQERSNLDFPPALRSEDEAIVHYLLTAAELGDEEDTGAHANLGLHFLSRDCDVARYYLASHAQKVSPTDFILELLQVAENEGCDAALGLIASHPGIADASFGDTFRREQPSTTGNSDRQPQRE